MGFQQGSGLVMTRGEMGLGDEIAYELYLDAQVTLDVRALPRLQPLQPPRLGR